VIRTVPSPPGVSRAARHRPSTVRRQVRLA
jgi:hypothetical protein